MQQPLQQSNSDKVRLRNLSAKGEMRRSLQPVRALRDCTRRRYVPLPEKTQILFVVHGVRGRVPNWAELLRFAVRSRHESVLVRRIPQRGRSVHRATRPRYEAGTRPAGQSAFQSEVVIP
jgi:hypothetical protein